MSLHFASALAGIHCAGGAVAGIAVGALAGAAAGWALARQRQQQGTHQHKKNQMSWSLAHS